MSIDDSISQIADTDVFSRGSLMFTFDILRKKDPQLALSIRNITSRDPLPKIAVQTDNKNSDHFKVDLDSFQVRSIVEVLLEYSENGIDGNNNAGIAVVAKTLMQDWMALARKMIDELPNDQKP